MLLTNQGSRFLRRQAAPSANWFDVAGQTCVAAYKAIGAGSLATSYTNLANPGTYNAAPGTAPGLGAGGWTVNGIGQYLTTGYNPTKFATVAVRFSGVSGNGALFGVGNLRVLPSFAGSRYYQHGSQVGVSGVLESGVVVLTPTQGYFNGAADGAALTGLAAAAAYPLYLMAHNNNGSVLSVSTGTYAAFAIYEGALSAADVAALTTRMQNLA